MAMGTSWANNTWETHLGIDVWGTGTWANLGAGGGGAAAAKEVETELSVDHWHRRSRFKSFTVGWITLLVLMVR